MKNNIFKPVISALVVSGLLSFSISWFLPEKNINDHWYYSLIFYVLLSLALNIVYIQKTDSRSFTNTIMAASIIRFLAAAVVFFIYSLAFPSYKTITVIHYMLHYFVFAFFEILFLLKIVNAKTQLNE